MNESVTDGDTVSGADVIAGPILRQATPTRLVFWLALRRPLAMSLSVYVDDNGRREIADAQLALASWRRDLQIGERAWLVFVDIDLEATAIGELPRGRPIGYDIGLGTGDRSLAVLEPGLCHAGERRPRFVVRQQLDSVLHGSCRRPHHDAPDGMARTDRWLAERRDTPEQWPALMLLTGDQIYADDVAGPMLRAVHALIADLGLWPERLEGATIDDSDGLYACSACYYRRDQLLPMEKTARDLRDRFFGGTRKPVFTSASSGNHLITLAEVLAMYLLVWSDTPWRGLTYERPTLDESETERWDSEAPIIEAFVAELPGARRLMANTPTAMIFDDHDITDDWNLTGEWMDTAYGHPFSRRIIGNALVAYFLCQGWGNRPEVFDDRIWTSAVAWAESKGVQAQDDWIEILLDFHAWDYVIETLPAVIVLDTRTRRWRRGRDPAKPSGLMDWEALSDMQTTLFGRTAAVMVSAAPIFGVKLIENIQRVFTWFGKPLMVDAENWMAHRGAAHTLLNIFRHGRTPDRFTILSGDVHYSFAYDVRLRFTRTGQRIWQITSSGVKNAFPDTLLDWFDRLNRWLYAPYSPLNWFTKRRRLRITPRKPHPSNHGERLVNGSGMGLVRFDDEGQPKEILELCVDERVVYFEDEETD